MGVRGCLLPPRREAAVGEASLELALAVGGETSLDPGLAEPALAVTGETSLEPGLAEAAVEDAIAGGVPAPREAVREAAAWGEGVRRRAFAPWPPPAPGRSPCAGRSSAASAASEASLR
mmetsp:Transcript_101492/g.295770  ORF Transcript_101492/g.295770 Transcript_101492/m.295770 type:complete len:119 (+) Transcript_101492:394-750(+)